MERSTGALMHYGPGWLSLCMLKLKKTQQMETENTTKALRIISPGFFHRN